MENAFFNARFEQSAFFKQLTDLIQLFYNLENRFRYSLRYTFILRVHIRLQSVHARNLEIQN